MSNGDSAHPVLPLHPHKRSNPWPHVLVTYREGDPSGHWFMGCSSGSLQNRESTHHLPQGHFAWQGAALGAEASGRRPHGQPPESRLALSWPCMRSALLGHFSRATGTWALFALALGDKKQATEHGTCSPLPHLWPCKAAGRPAMSDFQKGRLSII